MEHITGNPSRLFSLICSLFLLCSYELTSAVVHRNSTAGMLTVLNNVRKEGLEARSCYATFC